MLTIRDLRHPLGEGSWLDVPALEVAAGDRLVVFGPNGSGKSTLLRLAAGTLEPAGEGEVAAAPAAYLPQRPYVFRGSAEWNLRLGVPEGAHGRAAALARRLGLDADGRPGRRLSGGERQRLALARVLARPEPLVLLDEPLAPFDVQDRLAAARVIAEELAGRAAVIVTHDHDEAAVLGDRIAVLLAGRLRQTGPVAEVFRLPAGDDVAAAVGVGNALPGIVEDADAPLVSVRAGALTIWGLGDLAPGEPAQVLFGAEAVTLFAGPHPDAGSARNVWAGTVAEVRPAGRLVEVVVDAGTAVAAVITPGSLDALELRPGAAVTMAVKATAVRVVPR